MYEIIMKTGLSGSLCASMLNYRPSPGHHLEFFPPEKEGFHLNRVVNSKERSSDDKRTKLASM
jgi:hypothetical protein